MTEQAAAPVHTEHSISQALYRADDPSCQKRREADAEAVARKEWDELSDSAKETWLRRTGHADQKPWLRYQYVSPVEPADDVIPGGAS
jgi:hypothetical protein